MHSATAASPTVGSFIGVPIMLNDGQFFGTLCAVDPEPQELKPQQADLLIILGRIIATQIERDRELEARREAEAEQTRLYHAAQEAIREREALLSIASHELKNPLATVLGYAHLLQRRALRDMNTSERDQRALHAIVTQAERLNRMLTDLLDVSRLESGQFTIEQLPMDLSTLVHTVVEEMQPALDRHAISVQDHDSPVMVHGDKERLEQVLRNLLSNAIKYSPAGGQICIHITAENSVACVSIQDEGIGIPEDALPNLFQRFYRVANAAGQAIDGFGIGLYVVKEIVSRHGGTISVTSTEGLGTTFTMCLPLMAELA